MTIFTDAGTVRLSLTPSSSDVGPYSDAGTPRVTVTPSSSESHVITDADTLYLAFLPSLEYDDDGVAALKLTPSGTEYPAPFDTDLFVRRIESLKTAFSVAKWSIDANNRWYVVRTVK